MLNIGKWKATKTTVAIQVKSPVDLEKREGSKGRSFDVTKVELLHLMQTVSYVFKPNDRLDQICDRLKFRIPVTQFIFEKFQDWLEYKPFATFFSVIEIRMHLFLKSQTFLWGLRRNLNRNQGLKETSYEKISDKKASDGYNYTRKQVETLEILVFQNIKDSRADTHSRIFKSICCGDENPQHLPCLKCMKENSCEHQKEHKFWTKLLTTAANLVRDPIEQQKFPRNFGDILLQLGNLPAGMNERAFINFLESQDLINAHSINILSPRVVVVNILSKNGSYRVVVKESNKLPEVMTLQKLLKCYRVNVWDCELIGLSKGILIFLLYMDNSMFFSIYM